jgi:hypothetical protein
MSHPNDSTSTDDDISFLEFCGMVRNSDPSILPDPNEPFKIRRLSEREYNVFADALLENTNVTYLELETATYKRSSAEAMARYVRTSKHLQRIIWNGASYRDDQESEQCQKMLCCFLPAFQASTSLKELHMELPLSASGPSNLAFENMLTNTKTLRSLSLIYEDDLFAGTADLPGTTKTAFQSGLNKNTSLRELTLSFSRCVATVPPMLISLCDHPLLRRLSLYVHTVDLTGLEILLQSDTSKITELDIEPSHEGPGLTHVLQALVRRPTLTMLGIRCRRLNLDEARLLQSALCNLQSLQSLVLVERTLGSAELLAELAPALYLNTSIKVLDISSNGLDNMESAEILRDILRSNKTMTALDVSENTFGRTNGAVECIAEGLGSNSTLLKLNLSSCHLGDGDVSTLAQSLGSRDTTLQKLTLASNSITHIGVGVLLETMEQNSQPITDLDLGYNRIRNEGASLLAKALANNVLPNLTRLFLSDCFSYSCEDGFIELVSALKQNTSLLQLDLSYNSTYVSERAFLAFADSLPEIKVLQRVDFDWSIDLCSTMPRLLTGLRKNKSLLRLHVANCAPSLAPPAPGVTARCAGGWIQEKERLGYRNRFLLLTSIERPPLRTVWPHALARVAAYPDVIFVVLCCNPSLVPSSNPKSVPSAERLPPRGCWSRAIAWVVTLIDVIFYVQSQTQIAAI